MNEAIKLTAVLTMNCEVTHISVFSDSLNLSYNSIAYAEN